LNALKQLLSLSFASPQLGASCKMTNAVCESSNKSWVVVEQCRLRAISRNLTIFNAIIDFLHPANNIQLLLQLKKKANGYKPWLFDYRIDACTFIRQRKHPVFKLFWLIMRDFSTVNHTCPYYIIVVTSHCLQGKQMVKDFYYDPTNITLPIPSGDYIFQLTWIFDKKPQLVTDVYFTFY
ncbi:hypothetical protein KR222_001919, partial [Zaprionus bogoriensis]